MELVDANVVLRYILWDDEESSKKAEEILEKEQIVIPFEVIAEVVYVLEKVYGIDRKRIMQFLLNIFNYPNIKTDDYIVLLKGLEFYSDLNFDFIDALLLGYNKERGYRIYTFDKKMNKFMKKK